jgi:phosphatidylserine decarboxylase
MLTRLFVFLQYLLPKHLLTSIVYRVARIRTKAIKNSLIKGFLGIYDVDVSEVDKQIPDDFETFNDFFTRELAAGARPIDAAPDAFVSPVDGTLSQAGTLRKDRLLQAKGIDYTLDDLLAIDLEQARAFRNGAFATIYLAPYNYHRVHAPMDGELVAAHYVPGDLFSVNNATARFVPGLFCRNERLNLHFHTAFGPMALIFVGALNVGSISTPWTGEIRPRRSGVVETMDVSSHMRDIGKGDLLGWFNMGSTVILLLPEDSCEWHPGFEPGVVTRMGESIGKLSSPAS